MIDVTPSPTAFQLGPVAVAWYGIGYALAITGGTWVAQRAGARAGLDPRVAIDGLLYAVVFGLIGARLYHVIDQWQLYANDLARIVLPPYSGLGVYGGIAGGIFGIWLFTRRRGIPVVPWLDAAAPGMLVGQAIARWGNFFNQELYGGPTDLPWGIAIECKNRVAEYSCDSLPLATTGFHPLFFYESALDLLGAIVLLWLGRRYASRVRAGDLVAGWFIWYGAVRTLLEPFRSGYNWTLGGIPTAMLIGVLAVVGGTALVAWNHRRPRPSPEVPETPRKHDASVQEGDPGQP